jgi:4-amino-4-deoxy-L-arabinose transferase-like glycosyltransferase
LVARLPKSERGRRRGWAAALVGLVGLAAALRLPGIQYGLPHPLLNPDEANIVPRAWRMVHGGGLDPDWFDYPTLVMYALAPLQAPFEEPSYLTARVAIALAGVAVVAASWWLGAHAYGRLAGAVAAACVAVATTHVAYSHMAVTDVPLTLGVAASLALLVDGRLEWAGAVAGLAVGAKYPGVFLLVPLLVAGWGQWRRLAAAGALAAVTFAVTNPYVVLDLGEAAADALHVQRLAREGWLGFEQDHATPLAFLDRLWEGLGPALLVAGAGLAIALARRGHADRVLASFTIVYFLNLLTLGAHFDRYVLPLVPALGALAGRVRVLAPVTLVLLVVPLVWSIRDDRRLLRTDTRIPAAEWIERNVPRGALVAAEPSTPRLEGFRTLRLGLPGPGRTFDERRSVARLRRLGVDYVLVTGAVADRVLAARERYPRESRFYHQLEAGARLVHSVRPGGELAGPWVAVYRL